MSFGFVARGRFNLPRHQSATDIAGRIADPVQDVTELSLIPPTEREDKQIRYVEDSTAFYAFDAEAVAGDVAPSSGTGFWIKTNDVTLTTIPVATSGPGGGNPGTVTADSDQGLIIVGGVLAVRVDGSTIVFENGQLRSTAADNPRASATATGLTTTSSTTDIVVAGMSLTEGVDFILPGVYEVNFSSSGFPLNNNQTQYMSIYINGAPVVGSQRQISSGGNQTSGMSCGFSCNAQVAIGAGQTIEGRWRVSGGTASMTDRSLSVRRIGD